MVGQLVESKCRCWRFFLCRVENFTPFSPLWLVWSIRSAIKCHFTQPNFASVGGSNSTDQVFQAFERCGNFPFFVERKEGRLFPPSWYTDWRGSFSRALNVGPGPIGVKRDAFARHDYLRQLHSILFFCFLYFVAIVSNNCAILKVKKKVWEMFFSNYTLMEIFFPAAFWQFVWNILQIFMICFLLFLLYTINNLLITTTDTYRLYIYPIHFTVTNNESVIVIIIKDRLVV